MNSSECNYQHDQEVLSHHHDKFPWTFHGITGDQDQPHSNLSYFNSPTESGNNCLQNRSNMQNSVVRLGKRCPRPQSSSQASRVSESHNQSQCHIDRKCRKKEKSNTGCTSTSGQTLPLALTKENIQKLIHTSSENTLIKSQTVSSADVQSKRSTQKSVHSLSSSQTVLSSEAVYQMSKLEIEMRKYEEQLNMKNRDVNLFPILHTVQRKFDEVNHGSCVSLSNTDSINVITSSSINKDGHVEEKTELKEQVQVKHDVKESIPLPAIVVLDKSNDFDLRREKEEEVQPGEQNYLETGEKNTTTTGLIQQQQLHSLDDNKNDSDFRRNMSQKLPSTNVNPIKNGDSIETSGLNDVSSSNYMLPNTIKQLELNGSAWSEFVLLGVDLYGFFILTFPRESNVNKTYNTMRKKLNSFYSSVENQMKYRFNPKQEILNGSVVVAEIKSPIESSSSPSSPPTKYIRAKVFDILDKERKIYSCVGVDDFREYIVFSSSIFHLSTDFTCLPSKVIMCLLNGTESRFLKTDLCKAYKKLQSNPQTKINALVKVKKVSFNKIFKVPSVHIMTTSGSDLFQILIDIHPSIINWFVSAPKSDSRRRGNPEKKKKKSNTTVELSLYQQDVLKKLQERNYFAYV